MSRFYKYASAASAIVLLAAAGAVHAQQTTGGLKGYVTDASGKAVANAVVTIVHTPTGVTYTTKTDSTGYYAVEQLRVGGPYTVSVAADSYNAANVTVSSVGLGEATEADVAMESTSAPTQVVVRGTRRSVVAGRTHIGATEIAAEPNLNRDIRDYALKSPTAWEDPTNSNSLSLGGQSNRSNAILVDGVREGDDFGLNANGLPTLRSPISVDTLEAVNVDTAPYDVQYDNFQGGVINFVTKSGGNDFHGGLFYEKTGNDMRGKKFKYTDDSGNTVTRTVGGDFSEKTYGAHLSGPIIKDKLFFFVDYEKFEGQSPALYGPSDSNAANPVAKVSSADVSRVMDIMKNVYGYDSQGWEAGSVPYTDEKYFAKVDWQINDNHRATFSYQDTKSQSVSDYDNSTSGKLALLSHWYVNETDLKTYKFQLLSTWNDQFSTEFNFSKKDVTANPTSLGGQDFAEFDITTPEGGTIYLGPDRYRHYNKLTNNNTHFDLKGTYRLDKHTLFFGAEHEKLDIFNAFVASSNGVYTFASIDALAAQTAKSVSYSNAYDNVKADGAASFSYSSTALYAQDTWRVSPRLTLAYGLRYDRYSSKDAPMANATFMANYGFSNAKSLDGLDSWQPRFSFNWHPAFDEALNVYGGVGKFQGGQANVWISNNYSNTGNLLGNAFCSGGAACASSLTGVTGTDVGDYMKSQNASAAAAGKGSVNALDPNFKIPSIWKASLGASKVFDFGSLGQGYRLGLEYNMAKFDAAPYWVDLYQLAGYSGTAPDGRSEFFGARTITPTNTDRQDIVMKTADMGHAEQWILTASKAWHDGWANGLSVDFSYVNSRAKDIQSGTSSIASSNIKTYATYDNTRPLLGTSNYQIDRMAKLTFSYQHKFFGDNVTGIYLYHQYRTGQRYSFVYDDCQSGNSCSGPATGLFGQSSTYASYDTELLYVPKADASGNVTASSDPLVTYGAGMDVGAFNKFLQQTGLIKYAGQIAPRNAFKAPDNNLTNIRITQELPAISPRWGKLQLYVDVQNLGNMINPAWGNMAQYSFPYNRRAVQAKNCQVMSCTAGKGNFYEYDAMASSSLSYSTASVYQIKVGVNYKF